jgi:hypothetical protein
MKRTLRYLPGAAGSKGLLLCLAVLLVAIGAASPAEDPLPSWNQGWPNRP